ncbi:MAG: LysM peptidoglycan-binding domain-containing protein [Desulfatiglandales bacterium]
MQKVICYLMVSCLMALAGLSYAAGQEEGQETYAISLTQTAEVDKEIVEVEGKKVLTESYRVKTGDHLWQLFRERGLLEKRDLPELLAMLKNLNRSLANLDLIHPGEEILIPLTIAPLKGAPTVARRASEPPAPKPLEDIKGLELDNYTVKPGDSLIKIINNRYDIPPRALYREYLELVKQLNPSVTDLDVIHPNQKITLPVYSPQVVRMPIKESSVTPPSPEGIRDDAARQALSAMEDQLKRIFQEMGEEWVNKGEHFIPLRSGGEVKLNAGSFPLLSLRNGNRIIVDLYRELPLKMAQVIQANWENYRIVHLEKDIDLHGALKRILPLCDYPRIYQSGVPLELGGDIALRITADWIIKLKASSSGEGKDRIAAVMITDDLTPGIPLGIKAFLRGIGITIIEHPPRSTPVEPEETPTEILRPGKKTTDLVETLLDLIGQPYSRAVDIPVYQGSEKDFNLMIKADFLCKVLGRDAIIDFSGLGPDILSLLKEHGFSILSLTGESDMIVLISKTLDFLGIGFDAEPRPFMAVKRPESRNIQMTIPGISFQDSSGQSILATPLNLPGAVSGFLSRKGFRVLGLPLS